MKYQLCENKTENHLGLDDKEIKELSPSGVADGTLSGILPQISTKMGHVRNRKCIQVYKKYS